MARGRPRSPQPPRVTACQWPARSQIAKGGGLLGYGVDYIPMFHRAATFVDKVLKGAKPSDIPIEQATKFLTIVNFKAAKALGLEVPATLLAAADELIE
jgi:putative ABC transport system substrate-binding protein